MSGPILTGPFDIPEMTDRVPRRLKPWIFVVWVIIIQFSGGLYLAAATDMVGTKAIMQQDILMAGYAQLIGMSINFAVMFRLKFRYTARTAFMICNTVMIAAAWICAETSSVPLMTGVCFVAGWMRMWATFICNSTIQLWLTPKRDMSVFFCFVYIVVDGSIQLSGLSSIYVAFYSQWEYMHWIIIGALAVMLLTVIVLLAPKRCPMFIPLLGIDWLGALLWSVFMLAFTFICVYGNHYDWWESEEIVGATVIGAAAAGVNLWRATFLRHPYISFPAMTNRNVVRASIVYPVFFTLMGTGHVFEHSYAATILGFDETNLIDLNWYVFAGIVAGVIISYEVFALRKTRYKTMVAFSVVAAGCYLAYFYFLLDYGVEKEMLFVPLFLRGMAEVTVSIVLLTSIVQSGLPFMVFPQALVINGFMGAVCGAALGPAIIGEWLSRTFAKNASLLGSVLTDSNHAAAGIPAGELYGAVSVQALAVSMKEIYGWLLIGAILFLGLIVVSYSPMRPTAIFPKWRTIRKLIRRNAVDCAGATG